MKHVRKFLILSHRYVGIAVGLLIVMWFVTGIAMMYVGGMPQLTPQMRLERLSNLNLAAVKLSPAEAMERAGGGSRKMTLLTVMERPAYRIAGRRPATVFADTAEMLDEVTPEQARTIAARFANQPENKVNFVETAEQIDQWTIGLSRQMPLDRFAVDDGEGTEIYVQTKTGEVALMTTRHSRAMAWISTIPHWLYFTALRANQPLWFKTVVWTSAIACAASVLGLLLGLVQFRRTRPFRMAKSIPYAGWMRWHYITGAVFGVFTLTWAFSGLLSMEPFAWTRAEGLEIPRDVFTGGPVELAKFPAMNPARWNQLLGGHAIKEVEFARIQDQHYFVVREAGDEQLIAKRERLHQPYNVTGRAEANRVLVNAETLEIRHEPFSVDSLMARLKAEVPDVPVVEQQLLSDYDSYYYSRGRRTPLPVLRVKFGDPAQTWVYVDPEMSQMLASIHKLNRVERWLYNGLHSLDFSFWYDRRPLWDIGMIVLLLGGLASSAIGLWFGVKRLLVGKKRPVVQESASLMHASEPVNR